jgi:two-component system OmpR family response regulator
MKKRILIADDDPHIREVVRFALEQAGFSTLEASDGLEAVEIVADHARSDQGRTGDHAGANKRLDLVVLDVMMPEMDGTEVCRKLRADFEVPIVFLSSRDDEIDRVLGLELGGDDYITKPFSPRELVARVKAVLRRTGGSSPRGDSQNHSLQNDGGENVLEHGQLRLDLDRFKAFWGDGEVELTKTEFGVVRTMMGFPGKVYSRNELMDGAYDHGTIVSDRTIDSHVRRVRRKFEDVGNSPIETVHGMGYKLGKCQPVSDEN